MTEREKIIEIIKQASEQAYADFHELFREGVKRVRDGEISCFTNRDVRPTHDEILADKLIEAGFGYVKDLKAKLRSEEDYIHEQGEVIKGYKHRAVVAELALKKACRSITRILMWERCNDTDPLAVEDLQRFYLNNAEWQLREEAKNE